MNSHNQPAQPPDARRRLGAFGENAALGYLKRQGYTLRQRNWRSPTREVQGELDLVMQQQEQLVFVEVRTRRSSHGSTPEESITPAKQQRLIALACAYLEAHNIEAATPWRIDLVAITLDRAGRIAHLNHIPHAIETAP